VAPLTDEELAQAAREKNAEVLGPRLWKLIGKRVCVAGQHHLCGYRGIVIWCNEHLHQCGVRLEANNQLITISPKYLTASVAVQL
jgi:hypothetical protein